MPTFIFIIHSISDMVVLNSCLSFRFCAWWYCSHQWGNLQSDIITESRQAVFQSWRPHDTQTLLLQYLWLSAVRPLSYPLPNCHLISKLYNAVHSVTPKPGASAEALDCAPAYNRSSQRCWNYIALACAGAGCGAPHPVSFSEMAAEPLLWLRQNFHSLWGVLYAIFSKRNWPGQATWPGLTGQVRSRRCAVIRSTASERFFKRKFVFQPRSLMPLTGMEWRHGYLWSDRRWQHLDLSKVIRCQWPWLILCIPKVTKLAIFVCLFFGPGRNIWLISHRHVYSASLRRATSIRALTEPVLKRFYRWGWHCSLPGCYRSQKIGQENAIKFHFV